MLSAGLLTACIQEEGECCCCLTPPSQEQRLQSAFADELTTGPGFTFTASTIWEATVKNGETWLKLYNGDTEAYKGGAGETTLRVVLEPNETGEDRGAVVTIASGKSSFDIEVVQKGTKKTEKAQ